MASWKKIIVSGSQAELANVTASSFLSTTNPGVGFVGTSSWANNVATASYVTASNVYGPFGSNSVITASYALTASHALNTSSPTFIVSGSTGNGTFNASGDVLFFTGSNGLNVTVTDNSTILTASFGFPTDANVQLGNLITSDITVTGTASFQSTENLLVADRFILLASGSNTVGDGGLIIQQATQNIGEAFMWDHNTSRWAVTGSVSATAGANTVAPDAFAAMVIDRSIAASTDIAKYQKPGNLKIESGDIYIWS